MTGPSVALIHAKAQHLGHLPLLHASRSPLFPCVSTKLETPEIVEFLLIQDPFSSLDTLILELGYPGNLLEHQTANKVMAAWLCCIHIGPGCGSPVYIC